MRLLHEAIKFRKLSLDKERDKRRCQKCGAVRFYYTYALSDYKDDGKQRKVLLVCISCKRDMGIFFEPKDG